MSNRRKLLVPIAGVLAIVIGGFLFIKQRRTKEVGQPGAENTITGNDSQTSDADPQQRANYLIKMGDRMMGDGDYDTARSYYEAASKLAPSNTAAREGLASADQAIAGDSTKKGKN